MLNRLALISLSRLLILVFSILFSVILPAYGENERGVRILPGNNQLEPQTNSDPVRPYGKDWGLIIGINDYLTLPPLIYSVNDAQSVYQTLTTLGFSKNQTRLLLNGKATKLAILGALQDLTKKSRSTDRIILFFAGHGLTHATDYGEEGFLMPVDSREDSILETGISMKFLKAKVRELPAKHILLTADSCYSGYAVSRGMPRLIDRNLIEAYTQSPVIQVLTAGQKNQLVTEEQGHGIFTKFLLQGLEGRADMDTNGVLTALELGQWVQGQVIRTTNRRQIPMFGTLSGEGQFLLRWDLTSQPTREALEPPKSLDPWSPPIEEALQDIKIAYKLANQPRIAISFVDNIDGKPAEQYSTTKLLQQDFQQIGLRLTQKNPMESTESSKQTRIPVSTKRAELLIKGTTRTTLSRNIVIEGYDFHFYTSGA